MSATIHGWDGTQTTLPSLLSWKLEYGPGSPCDSFLISCPWAPGDTPLSCAYELTLYWQSQICFRGVVDEVEHLIDQQGGQINVSGRGMAARLLDNEALPAEYQVATTADILRDHVEPYGIQIADAGSLPPVSPFDVSSGQSEWKVLYQFARYYGGVSPRFDREGRLHLSPFPDTEAILVDDSVAVTRLCRRERRYGVLSKVLVRDRTTTAVETVCNQDFLSQNGCRQQVLTMPGRSNFQAMRYSGQFQIDQSRVEQYELELTVPSLFFAWPGDLIRLSRYGWPDAGLWRVRETTVKADGQCAETALVLAHPVYGF